MEQVYADEKTSATKGDVGIVAVFDDELKDVYFGEESGVDPVYYAKARILNSAIQEIGMGKYQVCAGDLLREVYRILTSRVFQWFLFNLAGFGWMS